MGTTVLEGGVRGTIAAKGVADRAVEAARDERLDEPRWVRRAGLIGVPGYGGTPGTTPEVTRIRVPGYGGTGEQDLTTVRYAVPGYGSVAIKVGSQPSPDPRHGRGSEEGLLRLQNGVGARFQGGAFGEARP